MPRKTPEPAAEPLEQAMSPPIIGETDVERRLDQELAELEARASPQTETVTPADPPGGTIASGDTLSDSQTEAETDETSAAASVPRAPRRRKAAAQKESGADPSQSGGEAGLPAGAAPEDTSALQTEPAPPADDTGTFLRPPRRRRGTPAQEGSAEPSESGEAPADGPAARARPIIPRGPRVVSIDEQRTVETQTDKLRSDLLDLTESLKGGRILTGTIQGVERNEDNRNVILAVLYHGDFKIIIPAEETVPPPEDFRGRSRGDVMHYLLMKRLGAEIDFIVKGVDIDNRIAVASRLDAMAQKRRQYYFNAERGRNPSVRVDVNAEARVLCAIRSGIFVEIFGVDSFIPLRELSYQRWLDAAQHFQPGQRVLLKILDIDRASRDEIKVTASVKQVGENPYEKALRRYTVGNRYVGTVSVVDTTGVFVSLADGIDCLCSFPRRGRPPRGSRVTVRINGIDNETNRIWGVIVHMTGY